MNFLKYVYFIVIISEDYGIKFPPNVLQSRIKKITSVKPKFRNPSKVVLHKMKKMKAKFLE